MIAWLMNMEHLVEWELAGETEELGETHWPWDSSLEGASKWPLVSRVQLSQLLNSF
jgi:hypothetical protein